MNLGAKRVTVTVIKDGFAQATAEAIFTARPNWGINEAKAVAAFLNSPAGQLFSKRIRSTAARELAQKIRNTAALKALNIYLPSDGFLAPGKRLILPCKGNPKSSRSQQKKMKRWGLYLSNPRL